MPTLTPTERLGNLGYLAIGTQTDKDTPVTPAFYTLLYEENLTTNKNFQKQQPAAGGKFGTYNVLPGQRDHQGDFTVVSEPNTNVHLWDMTLPQISNTGSGPYTTVFGFTGTGDPHFKTIDISKGNVVTRFWGVGASNVADVYDNNEEQKKVTVSALGSFTSRTISNVSTVTLTLDTTYDPAPTKGLVAGDLVRIYKESDNTYLDTAIDSVTNGTTVVLDDSAAAFASGAIIHLRPATPSFNQLITLQWARTSFYFADTVANAMSASQTRVEKGSTYEIMHPFESDAGSPRSGAYDPAALPRLAGDATLTVKRFFDTPEQLQEWTDNQLNACVVRKYSGTSYEERAAFYSITTDKPIAPVKSGEINYATIEYIPDVNVSDGNAVRVTVIHGLSSI